MRKEIQTLSEQLTQALKEVGELSIERGTTIHVAESSKRTQLAPLFEFIPHHSTFMQMPSIPGELENPTCIHADAFHSKRIGGV